MTILEVIEAVGRQNVRGRAEFLWPCFGPDVEAVIMGTQDQHWATAIVNTQTLAVVALDVRDAWWVYEPLRSAYVTELAERGLRPSPRELTATEILLTLAELNDDPAR